MSDEDDYDIGERAVHEIQAFLLKAQSLPIGQTEKIAEEFRVDEMLAKSTPHRRKVYDAIADYFEHVAKERHKKARDAGDEDKEHGIGGAVKAIIDNFDDD
ncbi:MAG: hypothetical protein JJ899_04715 [Alphaproteobacteria bacterium]|nr:hypothetical protein [Alphaproteobacteria bacterium]